MIGVLLHATREAEVCLTTTSMSQANIIFFLSFLAPGFSSSNYYSD